MSNIDNLAVEMTCITKAFRGVKAVSNANFSVKKGEVHALVGENGAGKSTLMKVLSGVYPHHSYTGSIKIFGKEMKLNNPKDANDASIAIIHQELALAPDLTVAENMFLGRLPGSFGIVSKKQMNQKAREILERFGMDLNIDLKVKRLGIGQQQMVEIAKALLLDTKIIILDEPTAPLSEHEINFLFKVLRNLRDNGITLIYISHRMNEIFELTDSITVMRDGCIINTVTTNAVNRHDIISLMIGRQLSDMYPTDKINAGEELLRVDNYTVLHPTLAHKKIVDNISMHLRSGEVVGISGLLGSGRTELMTSLFGSGIKGTGRLTLYGRQVNIRNPKQAIKMGVGFLTESRKADGLILGSSIRSNITLASLNHVSSGVVLSSQKEKKMSNQYVDALSIKTKSIKQAVSSLSGGNQQKVVLAKWLATNPKILILDEPTRGVDVGAKYEIYSIMKDLLKNGVGIIMISSDLPEIIGMSDRVYVMHEGKFTAELYRSELDENTIMKYATGLVQSGTSH